MDRNTVVALMVGLFTLVGSLGGTYLAGSLEMRKEAERTRMENTRWLLEERKRVYIALLKELQEAIGKSAAANVEHVPQLAIAPAIAEA